MATFTVQRLDYEEDATGAQVLSTDVVEIHVGLPGPAGPAGPGGDLKSDGTVPMTAPLKTPGIYQQSGLDQTGVFVDATPGSEVVGVVLAGGQVILIDPTTGTQVLNDLIVSGNLFVSGVVSGDGSGLSNLSESVKSTWSVLNGQTITAGNLVGLVNSGGAGWAVPGSPQTACAVALTAGNVITPAKVQTAGVMYLNGWGLTPGAVYYADPNSTTGGITTAVPTSAQDGRRVGVAKSINELVIAFGPYLPAGCGLVYDVSGQVRKAARFGGRPALPTTVDVRWSFGTMKFNSLLLGVATASGDQVTVKKNGASVAGWTGLSVGTTPAAFAPTSAPFTVSDGDLLSVVWTGSGSGLSFDFRE